MFRWICCFSSLFKSKIIVSSRCRGTIVPHHIQRSLFVLSGELAVLICWTGTSDLRDVLLCLVEFLSEVFGWRLAGNLDKGHLFAVTRQVARRLTHAVVVVSLDKKVWGVREPEGVGRRGDVRGEDAWWRGSARCLRTNSNRISVILHHPHGSGVLRSPIENTEHTQHTEWAPYPMRDLHTPCTAPGCSMGHLLQTKARKETKKKRVKISKMISYCKFFWKKLHFLTHKSVTFPFCPCCLSNAAIRLASLAICKATALNLLTFLLLLHPYLHLYTCWLSSPLPSSSFSLSQLSSPSLSFGPAPVNRCARIRESRGVIKEMKRVQQRLWGLNLKGLTFINCTFLRKDSS